MEKYDRDLKEYYMGFYKENYEKTNQEYMLLSNMEKIIF